MSVSLTTSIVGRVLADGERARSRGRPVLLGLLIQLSFPCSTWSVLDNQLSLYSFQQSRAPKRQGSLAFCSHRVGEIVGLHT